MRPIVDVVRQRRARSVRRHGMTRSTPPQTGWRSAPPGLPRPTLFTSGVRALESLSGPEVGEVEAGGFERGDPDEFIVVGGSDSRPRACGEFERFERAFADRFTVGMFQLNQRVVSSNASSVRSPGSTSHRWRTPSRAYAGRLASRSSFRVDGERISQTQSGVSVKYAVAG